MVKLRAIHQTPLIFPQFDIASVSVMRPVLRHTPLPGGSVGAARMFVEEGAPVVPQLLPARAPLGVVGRPSSKSVLQTRQPTFPGF